MNLSERLKKAAGGFVPSAPAKKRKEPIWKGPEVDGVTFSLLAKFFGCRERFRVLVVEGLRPEEGFNHRIEYGQMWHVCEEALASEVRHFGEPVGTTLWRDELKKYCTALCRKYPLSQEEIDKWYNVCLKQFPLYSSHWEKHPDVKDRTPLFQEQVFDVPYRLPSGRTVRLRGKWDSVDLIGRGKTAAIYIQENKTKGDIRPDLLQRQLTFDLQTMIYLVAFRTWQRLKVHEADFDIRPAGEEVANLVDGSGKSLDMNCAPLGGVRYNVVRRPLSGGKGTIVRHKATKNHPEETKEGYYDRLAQYIVEEPGEFFMRWRVEVSDADIDRFRRECLDPILEQLCDWYGWICRANLIGRKGFESDHDGSNENHLHWRHPFGLFNVLDEGGASDLDEYLATGSTVGLTQVETLFRELTP